MGLHVDTSETAVGIYVPNIPYRLRRAQTCPNTPNNSVSKQHGNEEEDKDKTTKTVNKIVCSPISDGKTKYPQYFLF